MLVLTNAYGFGVNFDQLGQRVLQSARNAGRTAQADVHIGHFLRGKLAGAVDRCARLAHDDALHVLIGQFLQLHQFCG